MDLREFDLNLLVVLNTLLTEQSVSKTAKQLGLSQPATSAALGRLRTALEDPILVRDGSKMVPTPRAQILAEPVGKILAELAQTLGPPSPFDPATDERTFKIATNDYGSFVLVPLLIARLRAIAPNVTLEVWPIGSDPKLSLKDREIDLAISDSWTLRHCKQGEPLFSETFTCLVRGDHPRIHDRLTLSDYLAEDHALVSARGLVTGVVDAALAKQNQTRRVRMTLPHILAMPGAIASTDLIVTVATRVARRFAEDYGLKAFAPPIALQGFSVSIAWQTQMTSDSGLEWLTREIRLLGQSV